MKATINVENDYQLLGKRVKLTSKSVPQLTHETGRSLIYLRKHGSRTEVTDRKTFFPDNAPTKYKFW